MSVSDEVKSLAENIRVSYETRIAAVSDIVKETHQTLADLTQEREEMGTSLRRKLVDFRRELEEMGTSLRRRLTDFRRELEEMAQKTDEFLSASERERKQESATLRVEIQETVAGIKKDTAQILTGYKSDREEMGTSLRRKLADFRCEYEEMARKTGEFLSASERERKQESATLRVEIQETVAGIKKDTAQTIAGCRSNHEEMAASLKSKMADLRCEDEERAAHIRSELADLRRNRKEMVASLRSRLSSSREDLRRAVDNMMVDFSATHQQVRAHRENLARMRNSRQRMGSLSMR
jgi:F0F1-type ATP synthase membrane subunit b/b'